MTMNCVYAKDQWDPMAGLLYRDPLEFIYRYDDVRDREIAGLIASALAYGRVRQILKSVSEVLDRMGASPYRLLIETREEKIEKRFAGFKHRFTTGDDIGRMLIGVKRAIEEFGSLRDCFVENISHNDDNILPALSEFTRRLAVRFDNNRSYLLPSPKNGSACKRMNLYLKWMIRNDDIDPGVWKGISPAKLIVPLDTHMHRIGRAIGLIKGKTANLAAALEMTEGFRRFSPEDPTKYDFAITRLGIREDEDPAEFISRCIS